MSNRLDKSGLILIGLTILILFVGIFCYSVILDEEVYIVAVPQSKVESGSVPCQITSADFNQHPALEELLIKKKFVLVSYGPFWDVLLSIDPRSRYHTVNQEWGSQYSRTRISDDEKWALLSNYYGCEFNGTIYSIVQTA